MSCSNAHRQTSYFVRVGIGRNGSEKLLLLGVKPPDRWPELHLVKKGVSKGREQRVFYPLSIHNISSTCTNIERIARSLSLYF